jgi:2-keto-4-pentenoate hydratase/2-oxohepta-3-ene-1,7-dioic acid hydratase in catechol pathway
MRWCRFREAGRATFGMVEDDKVIALDGTPFTHHRETDRSYVVDDIEWLPPVVPPTLYAVGLNYRSHVQHAAEHGQPVAVPTRPEVGYRANNALTGHLTSIVRPADCEGRFETEGEVVAVLGRELRRCSRDEAADAVLGWTIGNDVSARDWQHQDRTFWRAKNADTFKPMGPWIDTLVDPMSATTTVSINGETRASFDTGDMIFDALDFLCEIARYNTIAVGDVLWMGTDGVVGMEAGDRVDITISGLGTLTNPVQAAAPYVPAKENP